MRNRLAFDTPIHAKRLLAAADAYGRGRDVALGSLLADLELLSRAEIFVGTSASWTSRLALLAIIGEQGAIPPFALLDAPLRCVWCAA